MKKKWPFDTNVRGPNGRRSCRWCGKEVPVGRRNWCSEACVEDWKMKQGHTGFAWREVRHKVLLRDKGICAKCGCDTRKFKRIMKFALRFAYKVGVSWQQIHVIMKELRFLPCVSATQWQAHHIIECCRGGTNEMSNLQTLCVPCHKDENKRLAQERALERKAQLDLSKSLLHNSKSTQKRKGRS